MTADPLGVAAVVAVVALALAPRRPRAGWSGPWVARALRDRPVGMLQRRRVRPAEELEAQEVRRLAAAVRSGATVAGAVEELAGADGPWAADAAQVVAEVAHGRRLHEALARWAQRATTPGPALVAAAVDLADASGGALGAALDAVARSLAERAAHHREVQAASASARASTAVLIATPAAFAVVVGVADPRVGHVLVATPLGVACIGAAVALDLAGAAWMRRTIGRVGA